MTQNDIAQYMYDKLKNNGDILYQEEIAYDIHSKFGKDFVYENENGNLAIDKKVLKEFKTLRGADYIWDRYEKCWMKE